MKKILLALLTLAFLSSLQAAYAGSAFVSSVHFDDNNVTEIEFGGIRLNEPHIGPTNDDIEGKIFHINITNGNTIHKCSGSELIIDQFTVDNEKMTVIAGKCSIESSEIPKYGLYNLNFVFPSNESMNFSANFQEITTLQIDQDQGYFFRNSYFVVTKSDGLYVTLEMSSRASIRGDIESNTFNIKSSINSSECEGNLRMDGSTITAICKIDISSSITENGAYNFMIELDNPWDNENRINYSFEDFVDFSNLEQQSHENVSSNSCTEELENRRNSLTISHSGISLQTSARLKNALEKFYDTVETKFDTFEMQDKVYNEILEKIVSMKQSDSLSANAKNILLVLTTNIGYRLEEQKSLFSCEEYGVDFESLLDVNLD